MWTVSFSLLLWIVCLQRNAHAQRYPCDTSDRCQGETVCRMVYTPCHSHYCPPKLTCVPPPPSGLSSCSSGLPILASDNKTELICGRGGIKCPDETYCKSDLVDGYAACCWKVHKPGSCPMPRSRGSCAITCSHDNNCNGDQKCCSTGCGIGCVNPGPEGKSGFCPLSSPPTKCGRLCENDYTCTGRKKCCRTPCGTECQKPMTFVQIAEARQQQMYLPRMMTLGQTHRNMGAIRQKQTSVFPQQKPQVSNQVSVLNQGTRIGKIPAHLNTPQPQQKTTNPWLSLSDALINFLSNQRNQPSNVSPQNQTPSQTVTKGSNTALPGVPGNNRATPIPQHQNVRNVNSASSILPQSAKFTTMPQTGNGPHEAPVSPYQYNQQPAKIQPLLGSPMAKPRGASAVAPPPPGTQPVAAAPPPPSGTLTAAAPPPPPGKLAAGVSPPRRPLPAALIAALLATHQQQQPGRVAGPPPGDTAPPPGAVAPPTANAAPQSPGAVPTHQANAAPPPRNATRPSTVAQPPRNFAQPAAEAQPPRNFAQPAAVAQHPRNYVLPAAVAQHPRNYVLPAAVAQHPKNVPPPAVVAQPPGNAAPPPAGTVAAAPQPAAIAAAPASTLRFPNQRAQVSAKSLGPPYKTIAGNTSAAPLSKVRQMNTGRVKIGKCPHVAGVGVCEDTCGTDQDCPVKQKCCSISVCRVCLMSIIEVCPWQIKIFDMCHLMA